MYVPLKKKEQELVCQFVGIKSSYPIYWKIILIMLYNESLFL